MFTNDKYPRATDEYFNLLDSSDWTITETIVQNRVSIGANSTIVCGVTLGEGCLIGAGSVVTHDVAPFCVVVGNPAKKIGMVNG